MGEAAGAKSPEDIKSSTEDLPTPPDTPGPSTEAATTNEATEDPAESAEADASDVVKDEPEAPAKPEAPAVKKVAYHEDADLEIKVRESDGEEAVYAVCSRALETASRVWKQGVPSEMESDSAFALSVIFSIAHYKFQNVPQRLSDGELYDVALATEKSQTTSLLVPFVRNWLAETTSTDSFPNGADKTLVAGWVLGQAQWVSRALSQCAYNASITADGTLLDSEGKPWNAQPVPSEVLDLIASVRLAAVTQIIKAVSDPVSKLLSPQSYPDEEIRYCHAQTSDESVREECEELQLGSAIMGLTKARLWPPPEASRIKTSPAELARAYTSVKIRRYLTPGLRFQEGEAAEDTHAQCGFGHQAEIEKTLNQPAQLTPGVVQELETRAKRSGVYSEEIFKGLTSHQEDEAASPVEAV